MRFLLRSSRQQDASVALPFYATTVSHCVFLLRTWYVLKNAMKLIPFGDKQRHRDKSDPTTACFFASLVVLWPHIRFHIENHSAKTTPVSAAWRRSLFEFEEMSRDFLTCLDTRCSSQADSVCRFCQHFLLAKRKSPSSRSRAGRSRASLLRASRPMWRDLDRL